MKRALVQVIVSALFTVMIACADLPTAPTTQAKFLTITPLSFHLNVGEQKEFIVTGSEAGNYKFELRRNSNLDASWAGDLELIDFNKVRFTPRTPIFVVSHPFEVYLWVSAPGYERVEAKIFVHY